MSEKKFCPKCDAPFIWDMLTNGYHDDNLCVGRQLLAAKAEIKKLKVSVDAWKDAWFKYRDLVGRMAWQHLNCPREDKRE